MRKYKKGAMDMLVTLVVLVLIAGGAVFTGMYFAGKDSGDGETLSAKNVVVPSDNGGENTVDLNQKAAQDCNSGTSVKALLNDIDALNAGTDPSSNMQIFEMNGKKFQKTVADDATSTTIPALSSFKSLLGNNAGTPSTLYFSKVIEFETSCLDKEIQAGLAELNPASAPTISIVNDNGNTVNSDSNHESTDGNNTYTPCLTVKAPANSCSADDYGALIIAEYDASYVNGVEKSSADKGSLLSTGFDGTFRKAHVTNHSGSTKDFDQFTPFMWQPSEPLCDGAKVEICFDVEMGETSAGEDQGNVKWHWEPINKDLNSENLYDVITGIYDEDYNYIGVGNTTGTYYTA